MVGEVVAVGLAGSEVQPERVQRLAVIGELGPAVRAADRAERAGETAGSLNGARTCWHREPERQAAASAKDLAVCLLLRRVERLPGPVDQDGADPRQLAGKHHHAMG